MDETPRPQPRSRNLPAVGSGVTGTRDIRFDLNPPLWLPGRSAQVDADADIASASASTSATSASAASRTSRPASPSKDRLRDAVDLQLADFPIYIRKAGEGHLPYCVQALLTDLEEIEEGDKLVPRCIAPLLEQHRAGERALRPRYIDDDPVTDQEEAQLTRDLEALVAVMGIAREVERDESTEAAWNSEVHSPMLLICLRRWSDRVRHFNMYVVLTGHLLIITDNLTFQNPRATPQRLPPDPLRPPHRDTSCRLLHQHTPPTRRRAPHHQSPSPTATYAPGLDYANYNHRGPWQTVHPFNRDQDRLGLFESEEPADSLGICAFSTVGVVPAASV